MCVIAVVACFVAVVVLVFCFVIKVSISLWYRCQSMFAMRCMYFERNCQNRMQRRTNCPFFFCLQFEVGVALQVLLFHLCAHYQELKKKKRSSRRRSWKGRTLPSYCAMHTHDMCILHVALKSMPSILFMMFRCRFINRIR